MNIKMSVSEAKEKYYLTDILDPYMMGELELLLETNINKISCISRIFLLECKPNKYLLHSFYCTSEPKDCFLYAQSIFETAIKINKNESSLFLEPFGQKTQLKTFDILYEIHGILLSEIIDKFENSEQFLYFMRETLTSLKYLEENKIQIGQINPYCFVYNKNEIYENCVKFIYFGESIENVIYKSPENLQKNLIFTHKSCIYSWGILMNKIIMKKSDEKLFEEINLYKNDEKSYQQYLSNILLDSEKITGDEIKIFNLILTKILSWNSEDRPSFSALNMLLGKQKQNAIEMQKSLIKLSKSKQILYSEKIDPLKIRSQILEEISENTQKVTNLLLEFAENDGSESIGKSL